MYWYYSYDLQHLSLYNVFAHYFVEGRFGSQKQLNLPQIIIKLSSYLKIKDRLKILSSKLSRSIIFTLFIFSMLISSNLHPTSFLPSNTITPTHPSLVHYNQYVLYNILITFPEFPSLLPSFNCPYVTPFWSRLLS